MSEQEFNKIFSSNLNRYLRINEKTQIELANYLGVSTSAVSAWCRGIKTPRMDKVDAMCDYFGIKRSDLMEDKKQKEITERENEEATAIGQEILKNEELRKLFEASKDVTQEDLRNINALLLSLKKANKEK